MKNNKGQLLNSGELLFLYTAFLLNEIYLPYKIIDNTSCNLRATNVADKVQHVK